jgi:hypothetical protein
MCVVGLLTWLIQVNTKGNTVVSDPFAWAPRLNLLPHYLHSHGTVALPSPNPSITFKRSDRFGDGMFGIG